MCLVITFNSKLIMSIDADKKSRSSPRSDLGPLNSDDRVVTCRPLARPLAELPDRPKTRGGFSSLLTATEAAIEGVGEVTSL